MGRNTELCRKTPICREIEQISIAIKSEQLFLSQESNQVAFPSCLLFNNMVPLKNHLVTSSHELVPICLQVLVLEIGCVHKPQAVTACFGADPGRPGCVTQYPVADNSGRVLCHSEHMRISDHALPEG